jgi:hypothetical protein
MGALLGWSSWQSAVVVLLALAIWMLSNIRDELRLITGSQVRHLFPRKDP